MIKYALTGIILFHLVTNTQVIYQQFLSADLSVSFGPTSETTPTSTYNIMIKVCFVKRYVQFYVKKAIADKEVVC